MIIRKIMPRTQTGNQITSVMMDKIKIIQITKLSDSDSIAREKKMLISSSKLILNNRNFNNKMKNNKKKR